MSPDELKKIRLQILMFQKMKEGETPFRLPVTLVEELTITQAWAKVIAEPKSYLHFVNLVIEEAERDEGKKLRKTDPEVREEATRRFDEYRESAKKDSKPASKFNDVKMTTEITGVVSSKGSVMYSDLLPFFLNGVNIRASDGANTLTSRLIFSAVVEVFGSSMSACIASSDSYS